ncbi:MAG: hypothetical protein LBR07_07225 [Puniceicoccales bacterium]|jgi:hypothetical protein|nr:hypothetical protein [Puniceicoccales bacterium]
MPRRHPIFVLATAAALAATGVAGTAFAQNQFRPIARPKGGETGTTGGAPAAQLPRLADLDGFPTCPVLGKIIWVAPNGRLAVAWFDAPAEFSAATRLGARSPDRALAEHALLRPVRAGGVALNTTGARRIVAPGGTAVGVVVERGAARVGDAVCQPSLALRARLEKLPPTTAPVVPATPPVPPSPGKPPPRR